MYPSIFETKTSDDGAFHAVIDGDSELIVYGSNNTQYKTATFMYNTLLEEYNNASYKKLDGNWFVVCWKEKDRIFYQNLKLHLLIFLIDVNGDIYECSFLIGNIMLNDIIDILILDLPMIVFLQNH